MVLFMLWHLVEDVTFRLFIISDLKVIQDEYVNVLIQICLNIFYVFAAVLNLP